MKDDIAPDLSGLLVRAVAWAEEQSSWILENGRILTAEEAETAKKAGVAHPERVRISEVVRLPSPEDETLRHAALSLGLLGPSMVGLTLGYGIYIVGGKQSRFIPHELRHVYQYERMGSSLSGFLTLYLQQLMKFGYEDAPLEIDARQYEPV